MHRQSFGGENMDMHRLEMLCIRSDAFKSELIALHSRNVKYAEALSIILEGFQVDTFISKKTLNAFRNTLEYRCILNKSLFEGFIDTEISIKRMFHEEARKEEELEALRCFEEY